VGDCWRYALEANNIMIIGTSHIVHNSFIPCYNCIKRKHWCTCGCKQNRVPIMPLRRLAHLGQLMIEVSRSWTMRSLDNEVISLGEWYDGHTHAKHCNTIISHSSNCNVLESVVPESFDREIISNHYHWKWLWLHQPSHRNRVIIKVFLGTPKV
jgi:hypothetical protein